MMTITPAPYTNLLPPKPSAKEIWLRFGAAWRRLADAFAALIESLPDHNCDCDACLMYKAYDCKVMK